MDDVIAVRIARNDATFRLANERIAETAAEQGIDDLVPFVCECAEPRCTEIIQLSLDAYESVRSESAQFLNARGHEPADRGQTRVVAEHDHYVVVAKIGRAGDVARALDPRKRDEVA
jgi:hypothetical protein